MSSYSYGEETLSAFLFEIYKLYEMWSMEILAGTKKLGNKCLDVEVIFQVWYSVDELIFESGNDKTKT